MLEGKWIVHTGDSPETVRPFYTIYDLNLDPKFVENKKLSEEAGDTHPRFRKMAKPEHAAESLQEVGDLKKAIKYKADSRGIFIVDSPEAAQEILSDLQKVPHNKAYIDPFTPLPKTSRKAKVAEV